jgi:hypothetical protein
VTQRDWSLAVVTAAGSACYELSVRPELRPQSLGLGDSQLTVSSFAHDLDSIRLQPRTGDLTEPFALVDDQTVSGTEQVSHGTQEHTRGQTLTSASRTMTPA